VKLLEGKDSVESETIPINSMEDNVFVLLIQLYAYYQDVDYEVDFRENGYSVYGYRLKGFTLRRKENSR